MKATRERFAAAASAAAGQLAGLHGAAIHISGASGFLAANLLALLRAADQAGDLGLALFASARRPARDVPLFEFLGVDLDGVGWDLAAVEDVELPAAPGLVVVHAASFGAPADYLREPLATFRANTDGLVRLYGQAAAVGAGHVVYFSSAEIYGQPPATAIPTPESYRGAPDVASVRSIYGESKRMAEVLGAVLADEHGIPFTALRPFNLYGPGQRADDGRVPLAFVREAVETGTIALASDGTPRRSPCFVWDGLLQVVACLAPGNGAAACNIGDPSAEIDMLELARRCAAAAGADPRAVSVAPAASDAGLARAVPDVGRVLARARPPLPPFTALDDGLAALCAWTTWSARHA